MWLACASGQCQLWHVVMWSQQNVEGYGGAGFCRNYGPSPGGGKWFNLWQEYDPCQTRLIDGRIRDRRCIDHYGMIGECLIFTPKIDRCSKEEYWKLYLEHLELAYCRVQRSDHFFSRQPGGEYIVCELLLLAGTCLTCVVDLVARTVAANGAHVVSP